MLYRTYFIFSNFFIYWSSNFSNQNSQPIKPIKVIQYWNLPKCGWLNTSENASSVTAGWHLVLFFSNTANFRFRLKQAWFISHYITWLMRCSLQKQASALTKQKFLNFLSGIRKFKNSCSWQCLHLDNLMWDDWCAWKKSVKAGDVSSTTGQGACGYQSRELGATSFCKRHH